LVFAWSRARIDLHPGELFTKEDFVMKRCQSLLISVLIMFCASANSTDSALSAPYLAANSSTASALDISAEAALTAGRLRGAVQTQGNFSDFGVDVLKDIRATSAFVQEQAINAGTPNGWLIALAACGLVVLQLRRKHKSLPQRRIVPYA
jgi:hypothetical protein